jgi:hypothetical protein
LQKEKEKGRERRKGDEGESKEGESLHTEERDRKKAWNQRD